MAGLVPAISGQFRDIGDGGRASFFRAPGITVLIGDGKACLDRISQAIGDGDRDQGGVRLNEQGRRSCKTDPASRMFKIVRKAVSH